VISFKISETRKKKHMTNNVKTVLNLRNSETLRRKFLKRRFLKKMSIEKDKSVKAKRMVSKTRKHLKKNTN
jgi:hypothetical protein